MTFIERHGLVQYSKTRYRGTARWRDRPRYERTGPCELCDAGERYCGPFLVFDHCCLHGWVRGVICQSWNMGLGVMEWRLRAGTVSFGCRHTHRVQSSVDRCTAYLRRVSGRWLRADSYLRNCPDCRIPELVIRYPELHYREG
jgi:Recombination endonuclease VII